ncbi:MAG: ribosome-associated translation inhibitor RaiA [Gammaproteobacteria bacterium]
MQIDLTGHHVEITENMKEYINTKFARLERHFDNVTDVHAILSVEKQRHKAEATIMLSGGKIYADSTEESMYTAIDNLTDKLDRQIKKHKEKIKNHHQSEGSIKNLAL